jgi:ERCC4-type nuclease
MIIKMDINEYTLHPHIVDGINKFLLQKQQKSKLTELYKENKVIPIKLECGDYMFNDVLIEHMTIADFCGKVQNDLIFKQAQDMLYTKEKNPDIKLFILISGSMDDILKLEHPVNSDSMIAAWSSLNKTISTSFMGNSYWFIRGMINTFEKFYDGKIREYNPVRKPQEFDDIVLSNYNSIVGEETAKKLIKKFPYPRLLYNATQTQLMEVDGIGKEISEFIVNVSEGREKSWKALEEKKKVKKEQKKALKEQKIILQEQKIIPKDLNIPVSI